MRAIPGGPFDFVGDRSLPPQIVANLEAKYHLDWPMWKQFLSYLIGDDLFGIQGGSRGVIRGDFGPSYHFRGQTVGDIIAVTLPISAQLGFMSVLLAIIIGIPTGIIAALNQNSWLDYTSTFGAVIVFIDPQPGFGPDPDLDLCFDPGLVPGGWLGCQTPLFLGFSAHL